MRLIGFGESQVEINLDEFCRGQALSDADGGVTRLQRLPRTTSKRRVVTAD